MLLAAALSFYNMKEWPCVWCMFISTRARTFFPVPDVGGGHKVLLAGALLGGHMGTDVQ